MADIGGSGVVEIESLRQAIAASWGDDTRYASKEYLAAGRPGDPSRGQCGATALVLQDWLGGELLVADVVAGPRRLGVHYWNRLPDGGELDLTRTQMVAGEELRDPRVVDRPPGPPRYGADAYETLRRRVEAALGPPG